MQRRSRSPDLTHAEVRNAYDALVAELGKLPSIRAVLHRVGRGSMSTVYDFIKEFEAERPQPVPSPIQLSPKLQDAITSSLTAARAEERAIQNETITRLNTDLSDMAGESKQLEITLEEIRDDRDRLVHENVMLKEHCGHLASACDTLTKAYASKLDELADVRAGSRGPLQSAAAGDSCNRASDPVSSDAAPLTDRALQYGSVMRDLYRQLSRVVDAMGKVQAHFDVNKDDGSAPARG